MERTDNGRFRAGVDIGGTFTDAVLVDHEGSIHFSKVPSTPDDFTSGLLGSLAALRPNLQGMEFLGHGTTVGTNAAISRRGAPTALITTRGFRDVFLLRRTSRGEAFNLWWSPPETLLARRDIFEVTERLNARGEVLIPLDLEEVRGVVRRIQALGKTAVAVVLLHSFMNPAHERQIKEVLAEEFPEAFVSTSVEILPEIQEYERTSTTTINAYLGPVMRDYLRTLRRALADRGYKREIAISTSAGGVITPEEAAKIPALTIQSGPSAGVMAAQQIAQQAGFRTAITLDMGGTSTDIGLVVDGEVRRTRQTFLEWGLPIRFPCVDISSIGAGGGSIGWIDSAGVLRNGPQSAGAHPGPACYGHGGVDATNTDAQVVLGRLDPEMFLGGKMRIDARLAHQALETKIAHPLGLRNAVDGAAAMLTIATNNIVQALRTATVYRGYDPRDFVLVAFGGAGPLFATSVAREANIPTVVVPRDPGLTSALGLLMVDIRHDLMCPVLAPIANIDSDELEASYRDMEGQVAMMLQNEGVEQSRRTLVREMDARFYGTTHSITIPVPSTAVTPQLLSGVVASFDEHHRREYGYTIPPEVAPVEIVNLRIVGFGDMPKIRPQWRDERASAALGQRSTSSRAVYFGNAFIDAPVLDRALLTPGTRITGPAVVEQVDTTTVIEPAMTASVDALGNIIIKVTKLERH